MKSFEPTVTVSQTTNLSGNEYPIADAELLELKSKTYVDSVVPNR